MGRTGRYTLSVMVWVSAFAAWSLIVGLGVGAFTGEDPTGDSVSTGVSAVFYVLVPAIPTLVALWFNDWARDGFPTKDERRRLDAARAAAPTEPAPSAAAPAATPAPEPTTPAALPEVRPAAFQVAPVIRNQPRP